MPASASVMNTNPCCDDELARKLARQCPRPVYRRPKTDEACR